MALCSPRAGSDWNVSAERIIVFGSQMNRRKFCQICSALPLAAVLPDRAVLAEDSSFRLRYIVASCMYGKMELETVLGQVRKCGAEHIDIWCAPHANHREQIEETGRQNFIDVLGRHRVTWGIISRYDLGPFKRADEMRFAESFGARMIICSSRGPTGLKGSALKAGVKSFVESMKSHAGLAEKLDMTIGIENHSNSLISSPDSLRWFAEFCDGGGIGIALAHYHLPQDAALIAEMIENLEERLVHFYAWQHGKGCMKKLPKNEELLQMPGRGPLDFGPIIGALKRIDYAGWTEIFMHPVPRGIPILPTADAVTGEINLARRYIERCASTS